MNQWNVQLRMAAEQLGEHSRSKDMELPASVESSLKEVGHMVEELRVRLDSVRQLLSRGERESVCV